MIKLNSNERFFISVCAILAMYIITQCAKLYAKTEINEINESRKASKGLASALKGQYVTDWFQKESGQLEICAGEYLGNKNDYDFNQPLRKRTFSSLDDIISFLKNGF